MLALTLWQPWASLVVYGWKPIENRTWSPRALSRGERFAIHAGNRWDDAVPIDSPQFAQLPGATALRDLNAYERGAVIGTVQYEGIVRDEAQLDASEFVWWSGPLAWRVIAPRVMSPPWSMRGARGLWALPVDVARELCLG